MKITLRKAKSIRDAVEAEIKSLNFNYQVTIDKFEDHEETINKAKTTFANMSVKRDLLLNALYYIRLLVGEANSRSGIDSMLTKVARLEKDIAFLATISCLSPQLSDAIISGKVHDFLMAAEATNYHGRPSEFKTNIFTEENIETTIKDVSKMKKEKRLFQDSLMELNIQTKISISSEIVETLSEFDII